jgi:prepilin-type processing-associated H-X9-DG protein
MLVVLGIIALLISILLPPLKVAHRQAMATRCAAQEQQIGLALENAYTEYDFYPIWDDNGSPTRYTWLDVLVQRRLLGNARAGYCPEDARPSPLNAARGRQFGVLYPGKAGEFGIDFSYGIGVPLSAGGWVWRPAFNPAGDTHPRKFEDHERNPASRVLVTDATWSTVFNLSGDSILGHDWSYPTQYDNTVDWRHRGFTANILFQDGHVGRIPYQPAAENPVDTVRQFVWHPGEAVHVNPEDEWHGNFYPNVPPIDPIGGTVSDAFPPEMAPSYYTDNLLWTQIFNK